MPLFLPPFPVSGAPGPAGTAVPVALPGAAEGLAASAPLTGVEGVILAVVLLWAVVATLRARQQGSARTASEARAAALAAHLDRLARHMEDVAWAATPDLSLTACFPPRGMPGGPDLQGLPQPVAALIGPEAAAALESLVARAAANPGALEGQVVEGPHPATARWLETHLHPRLDGDGRLATIEGFTRDISTLHRLRAEVDGLTATDALTGLPTRRPFFTIIERELARARRNRRWPVLMILTLAEGGDGPPAAPSPSLPAAASRPPRDEARQILATVLAATVRPADALARLDEDTFAVLLAEASLPTAQDIAGRIQAALAIRLPRPPRLSIGLAEPTVADNPDSLLRKAGESQSRPS